MPHEPLRGAPTDCHSLFPIVSSSSEAKDLDGDSLKNDTGGFARSAIIHGIAVMPCSPMMRFHTMLRIDAMPPAADLREAQCRAGVYLPPIGIRGYPKGTAPARGAVPFERG